MNKRLDPIVVDTAHLDPLVPGLVYDAAADQYTTQPGTRLHLVGPVPTGRMLTNGDGPQLIPAGTPVEFLYTEAYGRGRRFVCRRGAEWRSYTAAQLERADPASPPADHLDYTAQAAQDASWGQD